MDKKNIMYNIMDNFHNIINSNKVMAEYIVTPIAPYIICDHFFATEIHQDSGPKYCNYKLNIKANDLLKNKNYNDIKNFDIVQLQSDYFKPFCEYILPFLEKKNIYIIIITSQHHADQIYKNDNTDMFLNNKHILLWISQNPIYNNNSKYMGIPYGLLHERLDDYINFVKTYDNNKEKNNIILNQCTRVHNHLPYNHIRRMYDIFGKNSGEELNYKDYLENISNAQFVISTTGDRDDCYRHYECIGLNAIPISNINSNYKSIFQENMIYSNALEMIKFVDNKKVDYNYFKPNRDILTIEYWVNKINNKINEIKLNFGKNN